MQHFKTFDEVWERASRRKGGNKALRALLSEPLGNEELAALPDAAILAVMCKCIFQAGFSWKVVDQKWDGFKAAFHDFEPEVLTTLTDTEWETYVTDKRIIRNPQKIRAIRSNLWFVMDTAMEFGSFGRFLADWPGTDLIGLFRQLKKDGSRLGGATGQRFLRYAGKDTFIMTGDVVDALKMLGLEIADRPSNQRDFAAIQAAFNYWHDETGLPYQQLSMVMARSVGENYSDF
jgi:3-methyladenine DNA glycosylase Tag